MILALLSLLALLIGDSFAIHLRQPIGRDAKVISYDLVVDRSVDSAGLRKRQTNGVTINGTFKSIQEAIFLIINAPGISGSGQPVGGTYNANASSSSQYVGSNMTTTYSDSSITGDFVRDNVTIGNITLPDMVFGVGYQETTGTIFTGVWGIGPMQDVFNKTEDRVYYTPYYLAKLGLISSPSYSLWLNDINAPSGSLLFGGVDTSKFTGALASFDIIPDGSLGGYFHDMVAFDGLYINNGAGRTANATNTTTGTFPINVTLDSGSTAMTLPLRAVQNIFSTFNVSYNATSGLGTCSCVLAQLNASIDFAFGDTIISVPMQSIVLEDTANPAGTCDFLITTPGSSTENLPPDEQSYILGDAFLRSAYVVYDFASYQISLAQAVLNSTAPSQILEIMPGGNGIPDAHNSTNQPKPSISINGSFGPTFVPTSVPTSAPTSVPTSAPTSAPKFPPTSAPPKPNAATARYLVGGIQFGGASVLLTLIFLYL